MLKASLLLSLLIGAATAQPLPTPQAEQTRKASFTYDETTGLLKEEWVEPDNPELCVKTTHEYDPYGNRSKSTTAPCPGASSSATFSERYATTDHSAAAQLTPGVLPGSCSYPLQTANQLGHTERKKFNPAFGQPEELLGPNGLKTTWSYDEFGRKVQETRADGSSTQVTYCYATSADNGPAGSTAAPPATASPARCRPVAGRRLRHLRAHPGDLQRRHRGRPLERRLRRPPAPRDPQPHASLRRRRPGHQRLV